MPPGQIIFFHKTDTSPVGDITIYSLYIKISSLFLNRNLNQFLRRMCQIAAAILCYHYHILNTNPSETRYINTRLNSLDHIGFQNGIVRGRQARTFMDEKTYTVTKSVAKTVTVTSLCNNISRNLIHTRSAYTSLYCCKTGQLCF